MPLNKIKTYNDLLELLSLSERERDRSLKIIFERDICNNDNFRFRYKQIRPLKKDGEPSIETLFQHLTRTSQEIVNENGKKYKSRNNFDIKRSERLHWIWHHIQEKEIIEIFSVEERIKGQNIIRTYLWDKVEDYAIVLEPYRLTKDYYLLTAYYLEKDKGGIKAMNKRYKRKLNKVY